MSRQKTEKRVRVEKVRSESLDEMPVAEIEVLNVAQRRYLSSIKSNIITFGVGVAGTGKSYIALSYAAEQLKAKRISKIIITRPIVEAGEKIGYLPGELEEKIAPYFEPMISILNKRLGVSFVEYLIKRGIIQAKPLAYLRGSTFEDAVVILDESQNTTPGTMQLFLTRIGENCKVIIDGDVRQSDIKGESGLSDAMARLKGINNIGVVTFGIDDVVRSGICRDIVIAYM